MGHFIGLKMKPRNNSKFRFSFFTVREYGQICKCLSFSYDKSNLWNHQLVLDCARGVLQKNNSFHCHFSGIITVIELDKIS